jgi:uncharacterized membrane protein HdeD (DUF308 family)
VEAGNPVAEAAAAARRVWWLVLLVGIAFVVFGVVVLFDVVAGAWALVTLFAAWLIVDGVIDIATSGRAGQSRVPGVVVGTISIVAGLVAALYPGIGLWGLAVMFAAMFILIGLTRIVTVIRFDFDHEGWVLAMGILQLVVGVFMLFEIDAAVFALVLLLAFYAILGGLVQIAIAFRLKSLGTPRPAA